MLRRFVCRRNNVIPRYAVKNVMRSSSMRTILNEPFKRDNAQLVGTVIGTLAAIIVSIGGLQWISHEFMKTSTAVDRLTAEFNADKAAAVKVAAAEKAALLDKLESMAKVTAAEKAAVEKVAAADKAAVEKVAAADKAAAEESKAALLAKLETERNARIAYEKTTEAALEKLQLQTKVEALERELKMK